MSKKEIIKELQQIPGVGPSLANDLWLVGIRAIKDLKNQDPANLYAKLCHLTNTKHDRCVLYVFRCAVYYASTKKHNPTKLKWWNWKDK